MKISPGIVLLALFSGKRAVHALTVSRLTFFTFVLSAAATSASAQDSSRWYQIEVTVFAHENSNTLQEQWPPDDLVLAYPGNTRRLDSLLDHLALNDWTALQPPVASEASSSPATETVPDEVTLSAGPMAMNSSDYRLPDVQRDAFVALPATEHDFTQTNRALNGSSSYRVLTHAAWRQPVMRANGATPIAVVGGRRFGEHHELEGTLTIRFNTSRDRVMLDTNLWLARFSTRAPQQFPEQAPGQDPGNRREQTLQLPAPPFALSSIALASPTPAATVNADADAVTGSAVTDRDEDRFFVSDVFPMRDSRAMRSNEFHYLDHPAIGVLVQVFPYEPPAAPVTSFP